MAVIRCKTCSESFDVPITTEQFNAWQAGELIQNAAPNLTPDQRELLISQTCGACFDQMFGDDDDE